MRFRGHYSRAAGTELPPLLYEGVSAGFPPPLLMGRRVAAVVQLDESAPEGWWMVRLNGAAPEYAGGLTTPPVFSAVAQPQPTARALARITSDGNTVYVDWPVAACAQIPVWGKSVSVDVLPGTMDKSVASSFIATLVYSPYGPESSTCTLTTSYSPLPLPHEPLGVSGPLAFPVPPQATAMLLYVDGMAQDVSGTQVIVSGYEAMSMLSPVHWRAGFPAVREAAAGSQRVLLFKRMIVPASTAVVGVYVDSNADDVNATVVWEVGAR